MEKLYKVLGKNGIPCNGGIGTWYLPKGKIPGKWMPNIKNIVPCKKGYHLCRGKDLIHWLNEEIYEVEYRGEELFENNKVVVGQVRLLKKVETWTEKAARLFSVACAKRVLPIFEKEFPDDTRPSDAITAAEDFANRKITEDDLEVARDAARSAARDAARSVARSAAGAAAWDAAWAAAWDTEREWQNKELMRVLEI